jgi:putative flippase GtrA
MRIRKIGDNELFRYGIAGATTTAVNLIVYHALLFLGTQYMIANIFAIVISKVMPILSTRFTFSAQRARMPARSPAR